MANTNISIKKKQEIKKVRKQYRRYRKINDIDKNNFKKFGYVMKGK